MHFRQYLNESANTDAIWLQVGQEMIASNPSVYKDNYGQAWTTLLILSDSIEEDGDADTAGKLRIMSNRHKAPFSYKMWFSWLDASIGVFSDKYHVPWAIPEELFARLLKSPRRGAKIMRYRMQEINELKYRSVKEAYEALFRIATATELNQLLGI